MGGGALQVSRKHGLKTKIAAILLVAFFALCFFARNAKHAPPIDPLDKLPVKQESSQTTATAVLAPTAAAAAASPASQQPPASLLSASPRRLPPFHPEQNRQPSAEDHEALANFKSGIPLKTATGSYELLNLRAVPSEEYHESLGAFAFERFGKSFYSENSTATLQTLADEHSFGVVLKNSNALPGILTGVLLVTLKDGTTPEIFAANNGLTLKTYDPDLHLAYLAVPSATSVLTTLEKVRSSTQVKNADPEILLNPKRFK